MKARLFRRVRPYKLFRGTARRTTNVGVSLVLLVSGLGGGLPALLNSTVFAISPANEYVSTTGTNSGDCSVAATPCQTITYALSQADNGTLVHVAAGTYTEALTINKAVTIEGAGVSTAITAPATFTGGGKIVDIQASGVTLKNLSVNGPFPASGCNDNEYGVYFENGTSATIENSSIVNIHDANNALFGCQQGIAVRVGSQAAGISASAVLKNDTVTGYQKGGVVVDGSGSSATITGTTVTGAGAIGSTAQNGIQVSRGAVATIEHDVITGNSYTLTGSNGATAAGILLYGAGDHTTVKSNTITGNQIGYYTEDEANLNYLSLAGITGNTRNAVAWVTGDYASAWPQPSATYADANVSGTSDTVYGSDIVAIQGHLRVWGYDAFNTVQGAINAVTANGTVNVADGTYAENLAVNKPGLNIKGQSQAGTVVNSAAGYGVDVEHQNGTRLSNFTFNTPASGTYALKAYDDNGLSLNNLTFNGSGKTTGHAGGVDVNSSQNVSYNNVAASNYSKNGFSVTAQYAAADDYSRNLTFNGVTANGNAWDGIAFYTTNSSGSVGHSIPGVNFKGTNTLSNNGNGAPSQGGLFIEGDSDLNYFLNVISNGSIGTPHYTVTSSHGVLNLNTTNFQGNSNDVTNYQTAGVNALAATFNGLTGNQMTAAQRSSEDGLIWDHLDRSALGLVQYHNVPALPSVTMFDANGHAVTNGGYITTKDFTFKLANDPSDGVTRYQLKYWNSISGSTFDGEGNAWSPTDLSTTGHMGTLGTYTDSFTQGEGTHYFAFSACNAAGNCSPFTPAFTVTFDDTAPAGLANLSPSNGTYSTTANLTQITWHAASDPSTPVTYYYESSHSNATNKDGSFVSPVYQSGALANTSIATPGTPEGTYYWHVKACDAAGNCTAWTSPWEIIVDNTAPNTPALVSPKNSAVVNGKSITQSWSDSSGDVDHYIYQSFNDAGATSLRYQGTYTGTSKTATNVGEATYYWRVAAVDHAGNVSTWSPLWKITVDNTAPTVTITGYGQNGNVIQPDVTATDMSPLSYQWTTDPDVTISNVNALNPTFTVNKDGTYNFTLTVTDEAGNTASVPFSFTYTTPANPNSPANNGFTAVATTNNGGTGTPAPTTLNNNGTGTNTPQILGTSTGSNGKVKGDSTVNLQNASDKKGSNFLGLGWWWLAIVAALALGWYLLAALRRSSED